MEEKAVNHTRTVQCIALKLATLSRQVLSTRILSPSVHKKLTGHDRRLKYYWSMNMNNVFFLLVGG